MYRKAHDKSAYVILNTEIWKQSLFKEMWDGKNLCVNLEATTRQKISTF